MQPKRDEVVAWEGKLKWFNRGCTSWCCSFVVQGELRALGFGTHVTHVASHMNHYTHTFDDPTTISATFACADTLFLTVLTMFDDTHPQWNGGNRIFNQEKHGDDIFSFMRRWRSEASA